MGRKFDMEGLKDKPAGSGSWWTMRTAMLVTMLVGAVAVLAFDYLDKVTEGERTALKLVPCEESLDCGEFGLCTRKVCLVFAGEEEVINAATGQPQNVAYYNVMFSASPPVQLCKDPPADWVPPQVAEVVQEDPCVVEVGEVFAFEFVIQPAGAEPTLDPAQVPELDCPHELNEPAKPATPSTHAAATAYF